MSSSFTILTPEIVGDLTSRGIILGTYDAGLVAGGGAPAVRLVSPTTGNDAVVVHDRKASGGRAPKVRSHTRAKAAAKPKAVAKPKRKSRRTARTLAVAISDRGIPYGRYSAPALSVCVGGSIFRPRASRKVVDFIEANPAAVASLGRAIYRLTGAPRSSSPCRTSAVATAFGRILGIRSAAGITAPITVAELSQFSAEVAGGGDATTASEAGVVIRRNYAAAKPGGGGRRRFTVEEETSILLHAFIADTNDRFIPAKDLIKLAGIYPTDESIGGGS